MLNQGRILSLGTTLFYPRCVLKTSLHQVLHNGKIHNFGTYSTGQTAALKEQLHVVIILDQAKIFSRVGGCI